MSREAESDDPLRALVAAASKADKALALTTPKPAPATLYRTSPEGYVHTADGVRFKPSRPRLPGEKETEAKK